MGLHEKSCLPLAFVNTWNVDTLARTKLSLVTQILNLSVLVALAQQQIVQYYLKPVCLFFHYLRICAEDVSKNPDQSLFLEK